MIERYRTEVLEREYQGVIKSTLKFMISNKAACLSLALNGVQMEYYKRKHPEIFEIFQKLISSKQLELLGGGYYDPVFPLLFPRDRTGQIDMLSSAIREATGKRPRGLSICASAWDSSLVASFSSCGMEYVLLDSSIIPVEKNKAVPLIMNDKGKSITILPMENALKPQGSLNHEDFLRDIETFVYKNLKASERDLFRVVNIQFTLEEFKSLFDSGFFKKLVETSVASQGKFVLGTVQQYAKAELSREPVYIASGLSREIAQWAYKPYEAVRVNKAYPITIFNFFHIYPQSRAIYDRMIYVSMLVNQSHGDKIRKKTARLKLWEAQAGEGFICTSRGAFVNSAYRQGSYKILSEVEKILRECDNFKESISCFDYNGDGFNEYICRMENYFAEITPMGGAVRELDVIQNSGNFADSLSRVKEFEGADDGYERALFVDHLFTEKEFADFIENVPSGVGIFSKMLYSNVSFSSDKKEVQFVVKALFNKSQSVSMRKKYVMTSGGMMIQYIIKNESDSKLSAKFAVESSFAQTNFNAENFNAFALEIVGNDRKQEIDTRSSSRELNDSGVISDVQSYFLTDTDSSISFMLEPNEKCALSFVPIVFKRPEYTSGELADAGMTFASTIFWDINLEPGMETEKTINFSIFNRRKKSRNSRKARSVE